MRARSLVVLALACLVSLPVLAEEPLPLRRFALVAGDNDGGEGRVRLKYAESDARSFAASWRSWGEFGPRTWFSWSTPTFRVSSPRFFASSRW